MDQQNKKANETDYLSEKDKDRTQLLMDGSDDKKELLVDDDSPSPLLSSNGDEKTELLSNFEENTPPHFSDELDDATETLIKDTTYQKESSQGTDSSENTSQNSDNLSEYDPINSNLALSVDEEPTEDLLDEVMTKTKKRKNLYIALGAIIGVSLLAALAFFIPTQMKASEINKSLDLGEKYLEEGKYEEAILVFDDVIAIEPKQVTAYEGKSSANIGLKNYTEAETQLETAKAIEETDNGKVLLSDVYINTNRKDLGKALLDGVINNQPEDTKVIVYASKLYGALNEYTTVIDILEKKIATTSDKEELKKLYNELINAYVKVGKTEAEIMTLLERAAKATGDQSYLDKKASYSVKKVNFNLAPGEYQGNQNLEIVKGNAADLVYYTIDGSEPGTASPEYTTPISLQPGEITVKVIEVNETGVKSPIQEGKYTIKRNKLTNEEFISKLYGYWYSEERKQGYLSFSNTNCYFGSWGKTAYGGAYQIVDTVANGGTIRIPESSLSDSGLPIANVVIEFDFGTPGDNKMSWHVDNGEWYQFTAVEYLGNDQYRMPASFNTYANGNIVSLNK